jgi:hypothetical protein
MSRSVVLQHNFMIGREQMESRPHFELKRAGCFYAQRRGCKDRTIDSKADETRIECCIPQGREQQAIVYV